MPVLYSHWSRYSWGEKLLGRNEHLGHNPRQYTTVYPFLVYCVHTLCYVILLLNMIITLKLFPTVDFIEKHFILTAMFTTLLAMYATHTVIVLSDPWLCLVTNSILHALIHLFLPGTPRDNRENTVGFLYH